MENGEASKERDENTHDLESSGVMSDVRVPISERAMGRLREKVKQEGVPLAQPMRYAVEKMVEFSNDDPKATISYIEESSGIVPNDEEEKSHYQFSLSKSRLEELDSTLEHLKNLIKKEELGNRLYLYRKDIICAAARWALEDLDMGDLPELEPNVGETWAYFQESEDNTRRGKQVSMAITKEAKEEIAKKAEEMNQVTSRVADYALLHLLEWIKRDPKEAWRYIQEDRDYYQPPRDGGYQYSYQFYTTKERKKNLERGQQRLGEVAGEVPDKRWILRAAGRWAIEDFEMTLKLDESGGQITYSIQP